MFIDFLPAFSQTPRFGEATTRGSIKLKVQTGSKKELVQKSFLPHLALSFLISSQGFQTPYPSRTPIARQVLYFVLAFAQTKAPDDPPSILFRLGWHFHKRPTPTSTSY